MITGIIFVISLMFSFFIIAPLLGFILPSLNIDMSNPITMFISLIANLTAFAIVLFVSMIIAVIITIVVSRIMRIGTRGGRK